MRYIAAMAFGAVVAALVLGISNVSASNSDLAGSSPRDFKAHLGQVVTLRGQLSRKLMPGTCLVMVSLVGAFPEKIEFYVEPKSVYNQSSLWEKLMGQQVSITGQLQFHAVYRPRFSGPPDRRLMPEVSLSDYQNNYYYMVMEETRIQLLSRHRR